MPTFCHYVPPPPDALPLSLGLMAVFDASGNEGYFILHADGRLLSREEAMRIITAFYESAGQLLLSPPPIIHT